MLVCRRTLTLAVLDCRVPCSYVNMEVNGFPLKAFIDSGAQVGPWERACQYSTGGPVGEGLPIQISSAARAADKGAGCTGLADGRWVGGRWGADAAGLGRWRGSCVLRCSLQAHVPNVCV